MAADRQALQQVGLLGVGQDDGGVGRDGEQVAQKAAAASPVGSSARLGGSPGCSRVRPLAAPAEMAINVAPRVPKRSRGRAGSRVA